MKDIVKSTITITLITLIAGIFLGLVYEITKDPIAQAQAKAKQEAYMSVFADADSFKEQKTDADDMAKYLSDNGYLADQIDEVMEACDASGNPIGYAMTVTSKEGYGGDITFTMGIQSDGTLNGIEILSISETAGLGMKADTDEFKAQFQNKKVEKLAYTKTGESGDDKIDAISGATITTNAMTNGVNAGLCAFAYLSEGGSAS